MLYTVQICFNFFLKNLCYLCTHTIITYFQLWEHCYSPTWTCIPMQERKQEQTNTNMQIDSRGNAPLLQAHFQPTRTRSKLINVPTAPQRVPVQVAAMLVHWRSMQTQGYWMFLHSAPLKPNGWAVTFACRITDKATRNADLKEHAYLHKNN